MLLRVVEFACVRTLGTSRVSVRMCICACVRVCMCLRIRVSACSRARACACACVFERVCVSGTRVQRTCVPVCVFVRRAHADAVNVGVCPLRYCSTCVHVLCWGYLIAKSVFRWREHVVVPRMSGSRMCASVHCVLRAACGAHQLFAPCS